MAVMIRDERRVEKGPIIVIYGPIHIKDANHIVTGYFLRVHDTRLRMTGKCQEVDNFCQKKYEEDGTYLEVVTYLEGHAGPKQASEKHVTERLMERLWKKFEVPEQALEKLRDRATNW